MSATQASLSAERSVNETDEDRLLTVKEAAKLRGVTPNAVHSWISSGRLKVASHVKDGNRTLQQVRVGDLNRISSSKRGGNKSKAAKATKLVSKFTAAKPLSKGDLNEQRQRATTEAVAYLFGHCEAYLEIYARRTGLSPTELARGLAEHLLTT